MISGSVQSQHPLDEPGVRPAFAELRIAHDLELEVQVRLHAAQNSGLRMIWNWKSRFVSTPRITISSSAERIFWIAAFRSAAWTMTLAIMESYSDGMRYPV